MKRIQFITAILILSCIKLVAQTSDIAIGLNAPLGLALNGSILYISENDSNTVSKFDLNGPFMPTTAVVVVTGLSGPSGLLLNGNDLYIAEFSGNKVSKIDITATTPTATVVVTGLSGPTGLFLNGNDLYITEFSGNKVSKIDITATTPTTTDLVTGLSGPQGLFLNGNDLYITEYFSSLVFRFTLSTLSINNYTPINALNIFPNPSTNFIQVRGLTKKENYCIYDILGSKVLNGDISENEKINIQNLTNGLYFLKFEKGNTIKFIKE